MQTKQTNTGNAGGLKHPSSEEWMAHIYGEAKADGGRLKAHLADCAECRARVEQWRGAMASLNEWRLPPARRAPATFVQPVWHWAAVAAALALGLGLGFGASQAMPSRAKATAELRSELRQELAKEFRDQWSQERQQLLAETTRLLETRRAEDNQVILDALREMNATHRADYTSLHKELETVAVLTESSLRQTEQQIVTLASYTEPQQPALKP